MPIFLLTMILLLSQDIFSADKGITHNYYPRSFGDLSVDEALRGHDKLRYLPLNQTPQFTTKEQSRPITQEKRTPALKGSTEKINDNK